MYIEGLVDIASSLILNRHKKYVPESFIYLVPRSGLDVWSVIPKSHDIVWITKSRGRIVKVLKGDGRSTLLELYLNSCRFRKLNKFLFDIGIFG